MTCTLLLYSTCTCMCTVVNCLVGERGNPSLFKVHPPKKTRYLFNENDTDQSYNLIIALALRMDLKCVLSL